MVASLGFWSGTGQCNPESSVGTIMTRSTKACLVGNLPGDKERIQKESRTLVRHVNSAGPRPMRLLISKRNDANRKSKAALVRGRASDNKQSKDSHVLIVAKNRWTRDRKGMQGLKG